MDTGAVNYFANRQLRKGTASWVLLASLGVSYVIGGHFSAWNYGLAQGGWGGLALAVAITVAMYFAIVFTFAELSTIVPTAGGGYGFARCAFGPDAGFITGIAILIEYSAAAAIVSMFIAAYLESLIGIGGWPVHLGVYAIIVAIHSLGVGEALRVLFALTVLAVIGLIVFLVAIVPYFDWSNLFDMPVSAAAGSSAMLPNGYMGIWAAMPFATAFFLAVEGVPMAAEEAKDPQTSVPKGMVGAMFVLFTFSILLLFFCVGGAGTAVLQDVGNPLVVALQHALPEGGNSAILVAVVNVAALIGLLGGMFAAVFAYSRQLFALSRAGYLPSVLSLTNRYKAPYIALIVPAIIGFVVTLTGAADEIFVVLVCAGTLSYLFMISAHIKLRKSAKQLARIYSTPGGLVTVWFALTMAAIMFLGTFVANSKWSLFGVSLIAVLFLYYHFVSRNALISGAPEEELAKVMRAESSL